MRLLLLLLVLACGAVGCSVGPSDSSASSVCVAGKTAIDAEVFARLTSTSWFDTGGCAGGQQPPTCNRIGLSRDGSYHWKAVSDYVERDQAGGWNFRARDATSGVICLDDGSVIDFALSPDGLQWGPLGVLSPDAAQSTSGARSALPVIRVSPLYLDLTEHPWANTNEMDEFYLPSTFSLYANGALEASFRGGECTTTGTFSLVGDGITLVGDRRFRLWPRTELNTCDLRSGGTPASVPGAGGEPVIEDGVLRLSSATYRDADIATDERYLAFSSYGDDAGLLVSATWSGALHAGATTTWRIEPRNDTTRMQNIVAMRIEVTPLVATSDGFSSTGPAETVVDRTVGVVVLTGETLPLEASFALATGWVAIRLEIESQDSRQTYQNAGSYITLLR
ncbi:MAG: hypothetical protein ABI175_14150 [Polyangiales bacterium]